MLSSVSFPVPATLRRLDDNRSVKVSNIIFLYLVNVEFSWRILTQILPMRKLPKNAKLGVIYKKVTKNAVLWLFYAKFGKIPNKIRIKLSIILLKW